MLLNKLGTIAPKKHQSFYRYFHPYFTRLPPNVVSEYIKYYSKPGDIVLDPFCGSGTVGMEALLLGRRTICSDLSPLAVFISRELMNSNISIKELDLEFLAIESKTKTLIDKIWTYGSDDLYSTKNKFFDELKNSYWYPQCKLSYRSNIASVEELYDIRQLLSYAILFDAINEIRSTSIKNTFLIIFFGTMSRVNLTYMVSGSREGSVLHNGGSSMFQFYDYRRPKDPIVIPVWERFFRKFTDVKRIKVSTIDGYSQVKREILKDSNVLKLDATKLHEKIEENSVSYIFTDPPYGAKIPYLELASMWASWMNWKITNTDLESEIIEGGELKKDQGNYLGLMRDSISSMTKVLKPNGHLSIVYQHDNLNVWKDLLLCAKENGLSFSNSSIQPTNSSSIIKKKFKGDIVSVPLIINFKKMDKRSKLRIPKVNTQLRFEFEVEKEIQALLAGSKVPPTYEEVYNVVTKILFDSNFAYEFESMSHAVARVLKKLGVKEFINMSRIENLK